MAELTREQFAERVLEVVREKFPLVKVARAPQPFSLTINGNPASLENLYRLTLLRPQDLKRHAERWIVEILRASEGHPDHSGTYEQVRDRIFPMVIPQAPNDLQPASMVTQPFVANLMIAYALDQDRTIDYIPRRRFEEWKISVDQLHETALANLVRKSETLNAHAAPDEDGGVSLIIFQTMDGYDASRILLPNLHDRLREYLGSPFAAGVPNRDILLCFKNDEATVTKYREQIVADYQQMPHQVSEHLLLVTADGIAGRD
jgi:uncharacterized protein YtpQ (UPF0354 family)